MPGPTVTVLLDDGTGTFPTNITSKVLLSDGFSFTRGREDEQSAPSAGQLSLTLINDDGRFTPGSTILGTPSPIKVDQRIRVKETVNGTTFTRFTGYVKGWPVSWPATVGTTSRVQITATDAQARGERYVLRSIVEEEILEDSPTLLYTLGEPAGAVSAGDTSGGQSPALTMVGSGTAVVFGTDTGPGTDGLTAATFAGGKGLKTSLPLAATPAALSCWFATSTNDANTRAIISDGTASGAHNNSAICILNGQLAWGDNPFTGPINVADGLVHHVVWQGTSVYCDGVLLSGGGVTGGPATTSITVGVPDAAGLPFIGSIAHVAAYSGTLSGARVLAQYQSGSTGFAGEADTTRITRLAGYAGIPVGTLDSSLTNVAHVDITGKSAWGAIQEVADAAVGVAYIDGSGNLIFHNRNRVPAKTSPDLTVTNSYLTSDFQPIQDDQRFINYLETTSDTTGVTQVVRDTTSETNHGRYDPGGKSYLVQTDQEALDRANWIVDNYAEPVTRYPSVTYNMLALNAAQQAAVLTAVEVDMWHRVTNLPSQTTGGTTANLVIEGYSERVSADEWTLTCAVVAQAIYSPVWILGDSTNGVLDSTTRLYV